METLCLSFKKSKIKNDCHINKKKFNYLLIYVPKINRTELKKIQLFTYIYIYVPKINRNELILIMIVYTLVINKFLRPIFQLKNKGFIT